LEGKSKGELITMAPKCHEETVPAEKRMKILRLEPNWR
jgi:hypothetical protein